MGVSCKQISMITDHRVKGFSAHLVILKFKCRIETMPERVVETVDFTRSGSVEAVATGIS